MQTGFRIGVDLGGTKIAAAAIGATGAIAASRRIATPAGDYDATIAAIAALVAAIEDEIGARAPVGIGIPGTIVAATGRVKNANSAWLIGRELARDVEIHRYRRCPRRCAPTSSAGSGRSPATAKSNRSRCGRIHRSTADRRGHRTTRSEIKAERSDHRLHSAARIRRPKAIGPCGLA